MDTTWWVALIVVVVLAAVATLVDGRGRSPRPPRGRSRGPGRTGRTGRTDRTDRRPPRGPAGKKTRGKAGEKAGGRGPRAGEIWWAMVPYEDGTGAKDRPCLVLSVRGRTALVAKITSKFHEGRPGVIPLPPEAVGDTEGRRSFLETDELRRVNTREFRRRVGTLEDGLWRQVRHLAR
ncbi:type II toxin-antitoxin system PemK/MazF family toxin [Streptomyces sp. NBC_01498]|uniref:type II toxin-antitoxin system PemK/MazF family toxin n=1 Tax=Streptomyces sp. NBC_01498 TaxID=2975870 RepID=UPI002E7B0FBC|nr:type II toxin-antitoxin system PemK/MazF family toxin [Streptomyces sp. NBC_01498]WTL26686.1 type II toxin-antitoxin system PemK/MazF family toxin [Streptomyces sp. NBC_01498]